MQRVLYGNMDVITHPCTHNSKAKLITAMHRTKSHNQRWNTSNDSKKKKNPGQMVSSMFIQGGPLQPIFSHDMVVYGIGRDVQAEAAVDAPDEGKKVLIERVYTCIHSY